MEKISTFLIDHWIVVLIINIIAIIIIIGYLIEQNKTKKKKIIKPDKKVVFDNEKNIIPEKNLGNNTNILETDNNTLIENNTIKNQTKESDDSNIQEINTETKQQIHDNIEKIINQSNEVFEEFDKVIPTEKVITDSEKESLEKFDVEIEPIKETKKNIHINTDIELPEIELSTKEEDIWN